MFTVFVLKGLLSFFPPTAELVHQSRACREAEGALLQFLNSGPSCWGRHWGVYSVF